MMPDWIPTFIADIGPTNAIVLMFFMGCGVVLWVMSINRKLTKDIKDLTYQRNVINMWAFAADKHIKLNGLKSGNSQGDVMLDWDGVPEEYMK